MKCSGNINNVTRSRRLNVCGDPDHRLDPINFQRIFCHIALTSDIVGLLPWQRYALCGL